MWRRLKRVVRSNLGRLADLGGAASPEQALARRLAGVEEGLITVRAEVTLAEERSRRLSRRLEELDALVAAATQHGDDALAARYVSERVSAAAELAQTTRQLETARAAVARGEQARAALREQRAGSAAPAGAQAGSDAGTGLASTGGGVADAPERAPTAEVSARLASGPRPKTLGEEPSRPPRADPDDGAQPVRKTIGPSPGAPAAPVQPASDLEPPAPAGERLRIQVTPRGRAAEASTSAPAERDPPRAASEGRAGAVVGPPEPAAPAPAPDPAPVPAPVDLVAQLERLAALRASGALSAEELEAAKRRLLEG